MFGLFDWIWKLLYGISKSMYTIIDNLLACANMLSGITPITYAGSEMDFLTFLLRNRNITYAFVGAVMVAIVLVVIFGIIAIIRSMSLEKNGKTPAQTFVTVGKIVLTFIFIPAAMTILIFFTNIIMKVLYEATSGGSPDGLGRFLAGAFGQDARKGGVPTDFYLNPSFNYHSTSNVKEYLDLSDYDYFFSWIASIVIIICLGLALLMFVDRAISIVILFIFAPISMSTAVLDDGARFKLWRDQFITKFLMGYGCILAINIYALIIVAITDNNLVFFENTTLNNMMKIVIVVGGGISMTKIMSLVGNLINAGAGSNELRDAAIAGSAFKRLAVGAALSPFKATRSAVNFVRDSKNTGLSTAIGRRLGFKTDRDYNLEKSHLSRGGGLGGGSGTVNNKTNQIGSGNNAAKNAIGGGNNPNVVKEKTQNNNVNNDKSNQNNNKPVGSDMVNDSVSNVLRNKDGDKKGGFKK